MNELLEFVGKVTIPATTEPFVAREHFVVNTSKDAPVQISRLGDNFKAWYLDKIERPRPKTTFCCRKLQRISRDILIFAEFGSKEKAETTLSEMFTLLKQQGHRENGHLLTNGHVNIFFVYDNEDMQCLVHTQWSINGWDVDARSKMFPREWHVGSQVFSRE